MLLDIDPGYLNGGGGEIGRIDAGVWKFERQQNGKAT